MSLAVGVANVQVFAGRARGRRLLEGWTGQRPTFVCVLAHTDTCLIPGLSVAGATLEVRPYTPAADAEAVVHGQPRCTPQLPSNPLGAPGPAGITRAALRLAVLPCHFVAAGLTIWPDCPHRIVATPPGGDIRNGRAVPTAADLFAQGRQLGRMYALDAPYLVLGESVPGGTTTASALLEALGIPALGRVSGSVPDNAHQLKTAVVRQALTSAGLRRGDGRTRPLAAVSAIGDPMQPLVAGMTVGAAETGCDVLLAGGSQMLAVAALVRAIGGEAALHRVAVGTTPWVVRDPAADITNLSTDVSAELPLVTAALDFSSSRHPPLRRYEDFLVKEGVGAGGACIAALLTTGASVDELQREIDLAYSAILGPT